MRNIAEIIKDDKKGKQLSQTERQIAVAYIQGKYDAIRELNLNGDRAVGINAAIEQVIEWVDDELKTSQFPFYDLTERFMKICLNYDICNEDADMRDNENEM